MTPDQQAELLELLDAIAEDRLGQAESARLAALLHDDAAAQAFYLKQVHLQSTLRWDLGQAAERDALKAVKERFAAPARQPATGRRWLAAAAALLLALGGWWLWRGPAVVEPESFAVLAQTENAAWEAHAPAVGARLGQGTLRLKTGLARIDYDHGARVTLEGPAEIDLVAGDRARVRQGQVMARVPAQTNRFRLETPAWHVDMPDAAYGVAVAADGAAELCVFQGQVEVTAAQPLAETQRLAEGKASRLTPGQSMPQSLAYDASRYARAWPISFGIVHTDGLVRFIPPGPKVTPRRFQDNSSLIVFPEREQVVLPKDIVVTVAAPGRYSGPFDGLTAILPAGITVRSYLLQFNPVGGARTPAHRLVGSITFDRPVMGLIALSTQLSATDHLLSAEGSILDSRARGIEAGDAFELSPDRRTLRLDWTAAAGIDQLRVVVAGAGAME